MSLDGPTETWQPDRDTIMMQQFLDSLESELESGKVSSIDAWIEKVPPPHRSSVFVDLLRMEIQFRQQRGLGVDREIYLARFPEFREQIRIAFDSDADPEVKSSQNLSMGPTIASTRVYAAGERPENRWTAGQAVGHAGRYRLDEFVGRGGFGEVWKGYDFELDRVIAIKVPRHQASHLPKEALTFRDEARRATKVRHPGIVEIHDVGVVDGGFFIISEFVDGPTLAQWMKQQPIPRTEALRIVQQIALILDRAHIDGLFHRDIKPSNILLRSDGSPVITDFGLAVSEEEQLTLERGIFGTLMYMSPEQARGETRLLDGRSDLYSLGVILFRMLTGRLPFQYRTEEDLLPQIIHREVRPLRSIDDTIPARLDQICLKCLAKEVKERYATGRDLAADLGEYLALAEESDSRPTAPISSASVSSPLASTSQASISSMSTAPVSTVPVPLAAKETAPPSKTVGFSRGLAVIAITALLIGTVWMTSPPKTGGSGQEGGGNPGTSGNPNTPAVVAFPHGEKSLWLPLLDDAVDKIVALRPRESDFLQQDYSKSMLTARAEETFWLLGTKYSGRSPVRVRGRVYLDDWVGTVGFVWGLSKNSAAPDGRFPRGYACVIERFEPGFPVLLSIREVQTHEYLPDVLTVGPQNTLATKEIATPKDAPVDLQVDINEDGVTVKINAIEVWKTNEFEDHIWKDMKEISGNIGLLLRGKTVVVTDAGFGF